MRLTLSSIESSYSSVSLPTHPRSALTRRYVNSCTETRAQLTRKQAPLCHGACVSAAVRPPEATKGVRGPRDGAGWRRGGSSAATLGRSLSKPLMLGPRGLRLTLACVLEQDSNTTLHWLLSSSNTCSGQVLDFSNTSSRPLSPFRLVSAGSKAPQQC